MTKNSCLIDICHRPIKKSYVNCCDIKKEIIMKKLVVLLGLCLGFLTTSNAQEQKQSPYKKIGSFTQPVSTIAGSVEAALKTAGFEILGTYNPESNPNLKIIAFTRSDLKNTSSKVADRGAMAAVLKVGFVKNGNSVTVSYTNPMYIFNAYLRKETPKYAEVLNKIANDVKKAMATVGTENTGFGGGIAAQKLWKYHYKIMMPYFSDPVTLNTYASFEEGRQIIEANLANNKSDTKLVYKLDLSDKNTVVYGVALLNTEDGEPYFLPKIGEENIAAMPYEIILQGNKVTMLHGKYRLALSWPELSMGTFMRIMSTPGDIEDMLKSITEQ